MTNIWIHVVINCLTTNSKVKLILGLRSKFPSTTLI